MSMSDQLPTGVLLLDKPVGPTSHDLVATVRRILSKQFSESRLPAIALATAGKIKVGHAGTLDPFATGLLVIGIGSATRLLEYTKIWSKEYEAEITLGATSTTDDVAGEISEIGEVRKVSHEAVTNVLQEFIGEIDQVPPGYAAIKVHGKKLYEYARAGQAVEIKPRRIHIHSIELLTYTYPKLTIRVSCGSGTYIRALARDIGAALHVGGYCSALRRTRHGVFLATNSLPLANLTVKKILAHLLLTEQLIAELPAVTITIEQAAAFRQGKQIPLLVEQLAMGQVAVFDQEKNLIGIGTFTTTGQLTPKKVLSI